MRKIFLFIFCLLPVSVYAGSQLTHLRSGVVIYSEYYPNPTAKFKGTIIFENGSGTDINEWKENKRFFNCAKKIGSVFMYDRNGLGKSPPDLHLSLKNPLTAKLISDKLAALLKKLNIKPPYLFVAHSYGAIYTGYFSLKYPGLVKGLVLVDPVPKEFDFSDKLLQKYVQGIKSAELEPAAMIYKKYPGSEAEVIYQLMGFEESKNSIKLLGSINDKIPVIVISSTEMEKKHSIKEAWYASQKQWINKNDLSNIIKVSSDHFIQIRQPKIICDSIKKIAV